jgi:hypothetical protein
MVTSGDSYPILLYPQRLSHQDHGHPPGYPLALDDDLPEEITFFKVQKTCGFLHLKKK